MITLAANIKKSDLYYVLMVVGIFLSFFDAHLEQVLGINRLPLPEIYLLTLAVFFTCKNLFYSLRVNSLNLHIFLILTITSVIGLFKGVGLFANFFGTIWLYKALIAFYVGWCLVIGTKRLSKILKYLFYVALVSAIVSWLQFFLGEINPFNFILASSGIIGIMDNPNKNGFILLYGFLYAMFIGAKNKNVFYFLFIVGIFFTQSRQIIIVLLIILFYVYVIVKKNYSIFLSLVFLAIMGIVFFKNTVFYRFSEIPRIIETGNYFRLKALKISFQVLSENLLFGTGPGTFGGIIANVVDSQIHEQYKLFDHWKYYRDETKVPTTIDMYWPHLVVETGLIVFSAVVHNYKKIYEKLKISARLSRSSLLLKILFIIMILMGLFSMSLEASYSAITIFLLIGSDVTKKHRPVDE